MNGPIPLPLPPLYGDPLQVLKVVDSALLRLLDGWNRYGEHPWLPPSHLGEHQALVYFPGIIVILKIDTDVSERREVSKA